MNILLTKEQIKTIRFLQKNLDIRVRENNDIDMDADLTLEKFLALKTELFEFVNELESFKYWKKNKGKSHILEEACDTLHFIFSIAIDKDIEIKQDETLLKDTKSFNTINTNELIGVMDSIISDCMIDNDWDDLNAMLMLLTLVLERYNFSANDLYEAYIAKNKVNHERQDNNY